MPVIKAIFWDNDGVLVDTERWFFEANRQIFAQHGFDLTTGDFIRYFLKGNTGAWHWLAEQGVSEARQAQIRKARDVIYSKMITDNDIAIAGVGQALARLQRNFRMAVVTSCRKEHFDMQHQRTGFLPHFDFVICGEDCTLTKPSPEPYLRALERTGLAPDECLVIEDSVRGLRAANAAGIECWVIPTELTRGEDFEGAARVLDGIDRVPELLTAVA